MIKTSNFQKKILVTAYDIEQIEHRGIAVFSKNLIRALCETGYEVWLLTSAPHDPDDLLSSILRRLAVTRARSKWILRIRAFPGFYHARKLLPKKLKLFFQSMVAHGVGNPFFLDLRDVSRVNLTEQHWEGRLTYLRFVKGFVNAPNIFTGSIAAIQKVGLSSVPTLSLEQYNFNGIIATCPLPIKFKLRGWQIQTIHDLIPIEIPSDHPWDDPDDFSLRVKAACEFPDLTLAASSTTAERISDLGFRPRRITVLYQPKSFTDHLVPEKILKQESVWPYVVSIGSIEPRKNILLAANAFLASNLPGRGYRYVLVGDVKSGVDGRKLRTLAKYHKEIVLTGYVDDRKRNALLLNSECLVFPSVLEGFGIPLVDAIQSAKKIICSDIPVFREVAQTNAVFVPPRDIAAWTHAFNALDQIRTASPHPKYEFEGFRSSLADILKTL